MTTERFTVTVATRTPQQSAAPLVADIGVLQGAFGLTITDRLNAPSELSVSFVPSIQADDVKAALLSAHEIRVWDRELIMFAGPTFIRQAQGSESDVVMSIQCRDLSSYLVRRFLDPQITLEFGAIDQATIVKALVDDRQAIDWGNHGIDTSSILPLGTIRDRTYKAGAVHPVHQRITELADLTNGFDFWVDSHTRVMHLETQRGVDRTQTVVLDQSNILNPAAIWAYGAEDIVSDAYAIGTSSQSFIYGHSENTPLLAEWGRSELIATYRDITRQGTIDDHASKLASEREGALYIPSPEVIPVSFDIRDVGVGDLVSVFYDYGLGYEDSTRRVARRLLSIGDDGVLTMGLELI